MCDTHHKLWHKHVHLKRVLGTKFLTLVWLWPWFLLRNDHLLCLNELEPKLANTPFHWHKVTIGDPILSCKVGCQWMWSLRLLFQWLFFFVCSLFWKIIKFSNNWQCVDPILDWFALEIVWRIGWVDFFYIFHKMIPIYVHLLLFVASILQCVLIFSLFTLLKSGRCPLLYAHIGGSNIDL